MCLTSGAGVKRAGFKVYLINHETVSAGLAQSAISLEVKPNDSIFGMQDSESFRMLSSGLKEIQKCLIRISYVAQPGGFTPFAISYLLGLVNTPPHHNQPHPHTLTGMTGRGWGKRCGNGSLGVAGRVWGRGGRGGTGGLGRRQSFSVRGVSSSPSDERFSTL